MFKLRFRINGALGEGEMEHREGRQGLKLQRYGDCMESYSVTGYFYSPSFSSSLASPRVSS